MIPPGLAMMIRARSRRDRVHATIFRRTNFTR